MIFRIEFSTVSRIAYNNGHETRVKIRRIQVTIIKHDRAEAVKKANDIAEKHGNVKLLKGERMLMRVRNL